MKKRIIYIDRISGKEMQEEVYGEYGLEFLYGSSFLPRTLGRSIRRLISRSPLFSRIYGFFQKTKSSRRKIKPFIKKFHVDASEFLLPVESFQSFNDFFIRHLKPGARTLAPGADVAIIPADGRYLFYQNLSEADGFVVKGQKFQLAALLNNSELAEQYRGGSMMIARLCPTDYHRFHFPCDCVPSETKYINGWLYSVNPIALKQNVHIFTENKRTLCELETKEFGKILYLEVGATNVGAIHQTYTPGKLYAKGDEKGYFSFGGSALILMFKPGALTFDNDLLDHPHQEIRCLLGQSMGTARHGN
jgi:phosphatidylserine decarboxylase